MAKSFTLTMEDAERILDLSEDTIRKHIKSGRLKASNFSTSDLKCDYRFKQENFDEFFRNRTVKTKERLPRRNQKEAYESHFA